jgi:hypothetical protein
MKTDEEIINLCQRAYKHDYSAVDEIHTFTLEERNRLFKLYEEGKI